MDESSGLNPGARPYAIYAGAGGVWFTDRGTQKAIGHMPATQGSVLQEYPTAGGADPLEIAYTSQNEVVFSEASGSSFGSLRVLDFSTSQLPLQPVPRGLAQNGISADRYGNVYVAVGTDYFTLGQGIYTYSTAGSQDIWNLTSPAYGFNSVIVDHTNRLWVSEPDRNYVENWDLGTQTSVGYDLRPIAPTSIVEGADHMMYLVDSASNAIVQLSESQPVRTVRFATSCAAGYITAGIDNDVWFTEPQCNAIGRLLPTTFTVEEFRNVAYPGGAPDHIAVDTKGQVWFTDSALHKIFVSITR